MAYADRVTTTSPGYAAELMANKEFKDNWLPLLNKKPFLGINHGIDLLHWNPKTDAFVKPKFDAKDPSNKESAREALQKLSGLPVDGKKLVISYAGPLREDRGADAFLESIPELVKLGAQVIIAGDLVTPMKKQIEAAAKKFPKDVHFRIMDEEYLHHLIAGSTVLVKPSRSESSGQFQRIALAYGTVPVIRQTGGITEGLIDADSSDKGNAFLMKKGDAADITKTMKRVATRHASQESWDTIVANAMTTPVGWAASAKAYDEFYRTLVKETK
jgi:starch synthase